MLFSNVMAIYHCNYLTNSFPFLSFLKISQYNTKIKTNTKTKTKIKIKTKSHTPKYINRS